MRQAAQRAGETGEHLKEQAERAADGARHRAADEIRTFGDAIGAATEQLEKNEDSRRVATYARSFSKTCRHAADYVERADLSEMGRDAAQFARKNPAMFVGGAVLAGFAIGRLLSAKPAEKRDAYGARDMRRTEPKPTAATSMYEDRTEGSTL